jgi:condensin complex subunit 3
MDYIEEEKKILAPLLGKLHVSPASSEDKIRELYSEVCIAVDDKLVADATGRNALFKIHVSLGRIVNSLGEKQASKSSLPEGRESETPEVETPVAEEEKDEEEEEDTVVAMKQEDVEEEDDDEEEEITIMGETAVLTTRPKPGQRPRDSLVDELLSDDDDDDDEEL